MSGAESGHGSPAVTRRIQDHLATCGVAWRELQHAPTRTSEDSARERGEPLEIGGNALLMKTAETFQLFVVSAARQLDTAAIPPELGTRKMRFARAQELLELTGLVPGSVPPFGEPILPFELFVDESITANERIAFNAGSLTTSIIMEVPEYLAAARPARVFAFSKSSDA